MDNENMDLAQLAVYLHRDLREVSKLANRGYLPGKKVGGEWRFASYEINHWIETQMHAFDFRRIEEHLAKRLWRRQHVEAAAVQFEDEIGFRIPVRIRRKEAHPQHGVDDRLHRADDAVEKAGRIGKAHRQ